MTKLDVTDNAWGIFLSIAKDAKKNKTILNSPSPKRAYIIKDVTEKKIIISGEGNKKDEELGKRGYLFFLERINKNNGFYSGTSSAAKKCAIANLHSDLEYKDGKYSIVHVK